MVKITLTPVEQQIAFYINDERTKHNTHNHVPCQKFSQKTNIELDGCGSELAVARHLNLYPDFCTDRPGKCDDLRTHQGLIIDVKNYSEYQVPEKITQRRIKPDFFVFTKGRMPTYTIHGWVPWDEIIREEFLVQARYNRAYRLPEALGLREVSDRPRGSMVSVFNCSCPGGCS